MGYFSSSNPVLDGNRNAYIMLSPSENVSFSGILGTQNLYYSGSPIVIRETWKIVWFEDDGSLLNRDLRWPIPKVYYGTYQILGAGDTPISGDNYNGFCTSPTTTITADSLAVIGADPSRPTVNGPISKIQQCNLTLLPTTELIEGIPNLVYRPQSVEPLMQVFTQEGPPDTNDPIFARKLLRLGIHANPGARPIAVTYEIEPVNRISNIGTEFSNYTCTLPASNCQSEFDAYVAIVNNGRPVNDGQVWLDNAACQAYNGGVPCQINQFTCSSGEIRTYYVPIQT